MKYLLSTGKSTSDVVTYIKDLIKLNLLLRVREIPYWDGGSEELIVTVLTNQLESKVREIVNTVITNISSSFDSIKISLSNITINNTLIKINININDIVESYDIKRSNTFNATTGS